MIPFVLLKIKYLGTYLETLQCNHRAERGKYQSNVLACHRRHNKVANILRVLRHDINKICEPVNPFF